MGLMFVAFMLMMIMYSGVYTVIWIVIIKY